MDNKNDNQKKVPKLRFPGFTDDWEQSKLAELLYLSSEKNDGTFTRDDVLAASLGTELEKKHIYFGLRATDESIKNYKVVRPRDVIYTKSPIKGFPNGIIRTNKHEEGIVPTLYCVYHSIDSINPSIIQAYFENKKRLDNYLTPLVNIGARNNVNITDKEFLEGIIIIPTNIDEQTKIIGILEEVSNIIILQQRKCDEMKNLKKSMLQKMFPKEGEQFPEIRFPGFTDAWEQHKLIEVCDYVDYRGKTPTKTEDGVFLVTAKNVKDGYIDYETSKEYISAADYDEVMRRGLPEIGDVLITTEAPCGNVAQVNRADIALAQRIIKYRGHRNTVDNTYLKHYLLAPEFQSVLAAKSSGGTVQGIKGSILHQQEIKFPKYEEQTKIGLYLDNLDNLITLQQRVCDDYKLLKKALLQDMFV